MQFTGLDKVTRKALNELYTESYAYDHEIKWYGIDAVAHVHLMRMAKDIVKGKLTKEKFIQKYDLHFEDRGERMMRSLGIFDYKRGENIFVGPLKKIESDGIFIPRTAYLRQSPVPGVYDEFNREVGFFRKDYTHRVDCDSWVDKEYAWQLAERNWQPSDLEDPKLIELGIKFGKDMWITCVEGFKKYNSPPGRGTRLVEKLIAYYSALVFE